MPSEEENKCCGKMLCVISFVTIQNTCTDREVLQIAIRARRDIRVEDPDYSTNSYRKAAYVSTSFGGTRNWGGAIEGCAHHV